jgi:hypothetical protein
MTIANKPTVPEVIPRVRAIGGVGCCLHIVVDDGNVEDHSVKFCLNLAEKAGHADCAEVARLLLRMSKTQRTKVYRSGP